MVTGSKKLQDERLIDQRARGTAVLKERITVATQSHHRANIWLHKHPGTGLQHPKRRRPNCSHFVLALWATFPVFRCPMEVQCLLHEWCRCLAVLTIA